MLVYESIQIYALLKPCFGLWTSEIGIHFPNWSAKNTYFAVTIGLMLSSLWTLPQKLDQGKRQLKKVMNYTYDHLRGQKRRRIIVPHGSMCPTFPYVAQTSIFVQNSELLLQNSLYFSYTFGWKNWMSVLILLPRRASNGQCWAGILRDEQNLSRYPT